MEKFRHRDAAHQRRIHEALHPLVRKAVEHCGLVWENCHHEDRGDGLLLLAPPDACGERLAECLPNELGHRGDRVDLPSRRPGPAAGRQTPAPAGAARPVARPVVGGGGPGRGRGRCAHPVAGRVVLPARRDRGPGHRRARLAHRDGRVRSRTEGCPAGATHATSHRVSTWPWPGWKRLDAVDFAGPYFLDHSGGMYSPDKLVGQPAIPVGNVCVSNGTTAQDYLEGQGIVADQAECSRRFADRTDTAVIGSGDRPVAADDLHPRVRRHGAARGVAERPVPLPGARRAVRDRDARRQPGAVPELTSAVDEFLADGRDEAFADHLRGVGDSGRHKPERAGSRLC